MGPSKERALIRKTLVLAAIFIASCMVVLFLVGDRFSRRVVVTDGGEVYQAPVWQSAMRSTWKEEGAITNPRTLEAGISERAGTFDPMTSSLCFARRDSEGTWNLYRASWSAEGWLEPEPLFELNSSADDTDPVFIEGGRALLFASRRGGGRGGFDIWRAEREGDTFADPICLPAGVNSPADDRHPTYLMNGGGLIFASNRLAEDRTRFELFECEKINGSWQEPRLMRALNGESESETRSPTISADGRFLFFSSDREGGRGGFDLWRSFRYGDRWQTPEPLTALNSEADELDPSLSSEGARLVFARTRLAEDGFETGLRLAERRELLRLETPGSRWWQTLLYILAAILIALLLAWLYLYWKRLHPFIKFLILSIILHILFLLMADPEEGYELPEGQGGAQAFRVTFLPSDADDASDGAAAGDAVTAEKAATEASMPASAAAAAAVSDAPAVESPSAASALEAMTRQPAASTAEASSDLATAAAPSRQAETARASVSAPRAAADTRQRQGVDTPVASAQGAAAGTAAAPGRSTIQGEANEAAQPSSADVTTLAPEPGTTNLSGRSPRPAVAEGLPSSAAPSPRPLADRGVAVPAQKTGTSARRRGRAEDEASAIADAAGAAGSTNAAKQSPGLPAGHSDSSAGSPATAQGTGDLSPTGNLQARGSEDLTTERPVTAEVRI